MTWTCRWTVLLLTAAVLGAALAQQPSGAAGTPPAGTPPASAVPTSTLPAGRMRGVCWEAGGRVDGPELEPLRANGVRWISQTPFGWQSSVDDPHIRLSTGNFLGFGPFWGETDTGIAVTTRLAHRVGIKVLLNPHLWLRDGEWRGRIRMRNESDWKQWFKDYTVYINHYAELAQREGVDLLCVGTELKGTSARGRDWRAVIEQVRRRYHGPILYAANWDGEADSVSFWDALNAIGLQAYFPLAPGASPALEELKGGWQGVVPPLAEFSARWNRPIIFTEVGYKSCERAAERPWEWEPTGPVDLALQARCYEALFATVWSEPWLRGAFIWKWHPGPPKRRPRDRDFSPQGKPAEDVLRRVFSAPEP